MYFCPCSCDDPIDPETEDNSLFALPRNLSYVQDSYLDRYSVSARFVHNPKIDRCIQNQQGQEWRANVEDETLGLLSAVTTQELCGKCDVDFESVNSSGFVFPHPDFSSRSGVSKSSSEETSAWSSVQPSSFSTAALLRPASVVASKISAFLHSPPNETMDSARDIGTSVDGDTVLHPIQSEVASAMDPSSLERQAPSEEDVDSTGRITFYTSSHSEDSDVEDRDACANCSIDKCDNYTSLETISPDNCVLNPKELLDDSDDVSQINMTTNVTDDVARKNNLSDSLELDDDSIEVSFDAGSEVQFSEEDIRADGDTSNSIPDVSEVGHSYQSSKYPSLKQLEVECKGYESKEDTSSDIHRDDSEGSGRGHVSGTSYGSPDSDPFIEEGVFVNIDDLDSTNDKSTTVSDASDDTCVSVDSMFLSPEEGELDEEGESKGPLQKMSLEEAINRAASDLTKMSLEMYGQGRSPAAATTDTSSSCSLLDAGDNLKSTSSTLKAQGRSSPIRVVAGLKIKITDPNKAETESLLTDSSTTLTEESPIYTEDEFNFSRVELRKSSSLKSNKTPPGTPHRKKVVRFADAMGLDLESVRHVLNMESPPKIPASALADLMKGLGEENKEVGSRYLCSCFSQPGASDNFAHRLRYQKVSLENAIINDLTITGFVKVVNIAYHKCVRIRYTHNSWCSFYDIAASYVQSSCDGPTDRFSFTIVAPPYFGPGSRLEFAVCFIAEGVEYWDNNDGNNYVVECFAKTIPTDSELAWLHFL